MQIKLSLLTLMFIITASKSSFAQSTPEDVSKKFFDLYKKDGSDKALDYLFSNNKYANDSQDGIDELKSKLKKSISAFGAFGGYDLLVTKKAGDNLVLFTFLVKHDRVPLTFRILFYKPNDKWQLQNFKFDNKMDEELEEASKGYRFDY